MKINTKFNFTHNFKRMLRDNRMKIELLRLTSLTVITTTYSLLFILSSSIYKIFLIFNSPSPTLYSVAKRGCRDSQGHWQCCILLRHNFINYGYLLNLHDDHIHQILYTNKIWKQFTVSQITFAGPTGTVVLSAKKILGNSLCCEWNK